MDHNESLYFHYLTILWRENLCFFYSSNSGLVLSYVSVPWHKVSSVCILLISLDPQNLELKAYIKSTLQDD